MQVQHSWGLLNTASDLLVPMHWLTGSGSVLQHGTDAFGTPILRLMRLLLVYVYNADQNTFTKLPDMPASMPVSIQNAKLALRLIGEGQYAFLSFWVHG